MVHDEVTAAADELCQRLTLLTTTARPDCPRWFRARRGPHYIKVELYEQRLPGADAEPSTFCFIARRASPFDWSNYRAGDVMAPMTSQRPWKMDTGAVANVLAPDGGESYWVRRYGADLGLW